MRTLKQDMVLRFATCGASAGITGFESPAAEYAQLKLSLDELLIERPSSTYFAIAKGRSMEGVGIFDRDLLLCDRGATRRDRDVIVANLNGEFVCKIIDRSGRRLLSADGSEPKYISEWDEYQEEGIVTRAIRLFREPAEFAKCSPW